MKNASTDRNRSTTARALLPSSVLLIACVAQVDAGAAEKAATAAAPAARAPAVEVPEADAPHGGYFRPKKAWADAPAGHYNLDPQHGHVIFQLSHYDGLSHPIMHFRKIDADYNYDPKHPEATQVEVRIKPTSIDSGDKDFDMRMQAPEALNGLERSGAERYYGKYQWITFNSTRIEFTDATHGHLVGDMSLLGVTRPLSIDFTYNGYFKNVLGQEKMGFSGKGAFKRSDFGMTGVESAGDQVDFTLELEFLLDRKAAANASFHDRDTKRVAP